MGEKMIAIERKEHGFDNSMWLVVFAVCVDLLTPYLIWKGYIPAAVRWLHRPLDIAAAP